jgi:hypothetical protein
MSSQAEKSFEIRTAHDYLKELLHASYKEYMADQLSSRKAIGCVIFAWHLHDWVWAQHKPQLQARFGLTKKTDYLSFLITQCPELEVIQDLANGSKHFKSDRPTVKNTKLSHGHPMGLLLALTQSRLVVETGSGLNFANSLLSKVMSFWDDFFKKYLT